MSVQLMNEESGAPTQEDGQKENQDPAQLQESQGAAAQLGNATLQTERSSMKVPLNFSKNDLSQVVYLFTLCEEFDSA